MIPVVPRPAGVRKPSKAAARLVLAATTQHHMLSSFADNLDGAEMGNTRLKSNLDNIKRVTSDKDNASLTSLPLEFGLHTEQASTASTHQYAGLRTGVGYSNQLEEEKEDTKS
jgi:hypothetical protein